MKIKVNKAKLIAALQKSADAAQKEFDATVAADEKLWVKARKEAIETLTAALEKWKKQVDMPEDGFGAGDRFHGFYMPAFKRSFAVCKTAETIKATIRKLQLTDEAELLLDEKDNYLTYV